MPDAADTTTTTDRAEALAERVRAMDAEVRAIEAEALALAAETNAESTGGGVVAAPSPGVGTDSALADSANLGGAPDLAAGAAASMASDQALVPADGLQRREFVRRVTSDAVVMAGKFYSLSRIITRSATAAGQAVIGDLESIRRDQEPERKTGEGALARDDPEASSSAQPAFEESSAAPVAVAAAVALAMAPPEPVAPPAPPPPAPVPLNLTPDQVSLLERVRIATLGVNRAGLSPHVTPAQFHWDGLVIRIPSLGWASRTTNVRREPHTTLFVEDPETGEFGAISGMTTIVERRSSVREQNDGLLRRYYPDIDPDEQWAALLAEDPDRVLLVLQPSQTIWGRRA